MVTQVDQMPSRPGKDTHSGGEVDGRSILAVGPWGKGVFFFRVSCWWGRSWPRTYFGDCVVGLVGEVVWSHRDMCTRKNCEIGAGFGGEG